MFFGCYVCFPDYPYYYPYYEYGYIYDENILEYEDESLAPLYDHAPDIQDTPLAYTDVRRVPKKQTPKKRVFFTETWLWHMVVRYSVVSSMHTTLFCSK